MNVRRVAVSRTWAGLYRLAAIIGVLAALAALWRWGPLGGAVDVETLQLWGAWLRDTWLALPIVILVFIVAGLLAAPAVLLITATVLLFEPLEGFIYALLGTLASAAVSYGLGSFLGGSAIRRLAGTRLHQLSDALGRRGVLSAAAARLIPVAPFTIVNLVAGASHIKFRDFIVGTALALAPGILAMALFADQLRGVIGAPTAQGFAALVAIIVAVGLAALWIKRKLSGRRQ